MAIKSAKETKSEMNTTNGVVIVAEENQENLVIVSDETQAKLDDLKEEETAELGEEVTLVETTQATVEKMVKVKMKANHKCNIGGEWYYLTKGKTETVPENVKNILLKDDLLSPL